MSPRPIPECGTRPAYQRHLRLGEPVDEPCRIANTKADRRLRETGTTKENRAEERPPAVKTPAVRKPVPAIGWREYAACREVDPELFFPDPGQHTVARDAIRVCGHCSVRAACEAHALGEDGSDGERYGVWGGLTAVERQRILRHRRKWAS